MSPSGKVPLLALSHLHGGYGEVHVLHGIDLMVHEGEIVCLVGSNGAGKTTLLRAISRIIAATGSIHYNGVEIMPLKPEQVFALGLVQVPEGRQLFGGMSVEENLLMGSHLQRDKIKIRDSFESVYTLFPRLYERRAQQAGSLSGGEQQMCAMARGLMARPRLLMVDEMSLGLAPVVVDQLLDVLAKIRQQGVTLLLVEQDVFAAFAIADRGYVLETGSVVREGRVADLSCDPDVQRAYLGGVA